MSVYFFFTSFTVSCKTVCKGIGKGNRFQYLLEKVILLTAPSPSNKSATWPSVIKTYENENGWRALKSHFEF